MYPDINYIFVTNLAEKGKFIMSLTRGRSHSVSHSLSKLTLCLVKNLVLAPCSILVALIGTKASKSIFLLYSKNLHLSMDKMFKYGKI